jgi:hypothetical protein
LLPFFIASRENLSYDPNEFIIFVVGNPGCTSSMTVRVIWEVVITCDSRFPEGLFELGVIGIHGVMMIVALLLM